jgi:hypothetical protein
MTTHDLRHVSGQRPARLRAHGRLAGLLALLSLGALGLAGCLRLLALHGGRGGPLDELRSYLATGRPLVAEAGRLCPLTPEPSACATAARELEASLADVEQALHAAGACQGDGARVCLAEARVAAAALAPRVAERVLRLASLTAPGAR